MNQEQAKKALAELQEKRKILADKQLEIEKNYWENKLAEDEYYIEGLLFDRIFTELQTALNLKDGIYVQLELEHTKLSGSKFIRSEKLIENMLEAGLKISLSRWGHDINNTKTYAIVEIDRNRLLDDSLYNRPVTTDFKQMLEKGNLKENWFINILRSYVQKRMRPEKREETETALAMRYYDQMTDEWYRYAKADVLQTEREAGTPWIYPEKILDEIFGDFNNVLKKLESALDEDGFKMYLVDNDMAEKGKSFMIKMREKELLLDQHTGLLTTVLINK